MGNDEYTVFVGGVEVNDHLLTEQQGKALADEYRAQGYVDVALVRIVREK